MALLHRARLDPTKRELLDGWLPRQGWYDGTVERGPVGTFRLDDPDGQVGMEGFLLGSAGGSTLFVPLTYRPAPLEGGDEHLVGTTEHSVLGTRWVYDACGDPAWVRAVFTTIATGGTQAEERFEGDGGTEIREPSATVRGTGAPDTEVPAVTMAKCRDDGAVTIVDVGETGRLDLVVVRSVGAPVVSEQLLLATWEGGQDVVLAGLLAGQHTAQPDR